jgi:hypothetical protein
MASSNGRLAEISRHRATSRDALYEYTGATGMTVVGAVSRLTYRFGSPGARVQVDLRDVGSMMGVPNLRRV